MLLVTCLCSQAAEVILPSAAWSHYILGLLTLGRKAFGFRSQLLLRLLLGGMTCCFGRASDGTRTCMMSYTPLRRCLALSEQQMVALMQSQTAKGGEVLAIRAKHLLRSRRQEWPPAGSTRRCLRDMYSEQPTCVLGGPPPVMRLVVVLVNSTDHTRLVHYVSVCATVVSALHSACYDCLLYWGAMTVYFRCSHLQTA